KCRHKTVKIVLDSESPDDSNGADSTTLACQGDSAEVIQVEADSAVGRNWWCRQRSRPKRREIKALVFFRRKVRTKAGGGATTDGRTAVLIGWAGGRAT